MHCTPSPDWLAVPILLCLCESIECYGVPICRRDS